MVKLKLQLDWGVSQAIDTKSNTDVCISEGREKLVLLISSCIGVDGWMFVYLKPVRWWVGFDVDLIPGSFFFVYQKFTSRFMEALHLTLLQNEGKLNRFAKTKECQDKDNYGHRVFIHLVFVNKWIYQFILWRSVKISIDWKFDFFKIIWL